MEKQLRNLGRVVRLAFRPLLNQRGQAGPDDGNENDKITVKVGEEEKTFTATDITNLINQSSEATQKAQQTAAIVQAAERYGVSVDQLLQNAEGSFGVMSKLMDAGIIDERGEIIEKRAGDPPKGDDPLKNLFNQPSGDPPVAGTKQLEVAMKGLMEPLTKQIETLTETTSRLRSDNVNLMRLRLSDKIADRFDNLGDEDIVQVFHRAEQDNSKSLMQHAEALSKAKAENAGKLEQEFAKKYGIDIDKAKEHAAFEQDPSGAAAALVTDKKVSFKKGKDTVTPVEASKNFFSKFEGFKLTE